MRTDDIMSVIAKGIETTILKDMMHEGGVFGNSNVHVNFEIDDREYVLLLREIGDGEHWSEMRIEREVEHNGW